MSQALAIKVNSLEKRVELLERDAERIRSVLEPQGLEYRAVHRGFGHWFAEGPGEVKMNTEALTKDEAQALADELNGIAA